MRLVSLHERSAVSNFPLSASGEGQGEETYNVFKYSITAFRSASVK